MHTDDDTGLPPDDFFARDIRTNYESKMRYPFAFDFSPDYPLCYHELKISNRLVKFVNYEFYELITNSITNSDAVKRPL